MTIARPWPKPTATAKPPAKLGDLILAALNATAEEKAIQCDYRERRKGLDDLAKATKVTLQAEQAMWRRLREVAPEEIGGDAA